MAMAFCQYKSKKVVFCGDISSILIDVIEGCHIKFSPSLLTYTKALVPTWLESPPHSHTTGVALCRHNVVVSGVSSEPLREGDGGPLAQGVGGVPVDQVGIGRVCTIVNGAVVPWLENYALHKRP